jgi:hypothetical protein
MASPSTTFLLLLLPVLLQTTLSHAFIVVVNVVNSPPSLLSAAASSSKKKKKLAVVGRRRSGEGFGSSSSTTTISRDDGDGDIIVYPELDPQVVKTLVPYNHEQGGRGSGGGGGILPIEIYDRLDEIYGFDKFNFGGENAIYKSIRTTETTTAATTITTATTTDVNADAPSLFDDVLSGGGHSTLASSDDDKSHHVSFDLNAIPPFEHFRILHTDPMVLAIDDFFTVEECDRYVQLSINSEQQQRRRASSIVDGDNDKNNILYKPMVLGQSRTMGTDSYSRAQRTSTTWFHHYGGVPELITKASRLLGLENINRWEEPQTVRYRRNEKFTWHLDALSPTDVINDDDDDDGAGQRIATLLVYLTDLPEKDGGATMFRDLGGNNGPPLKV